MQQLIKNLLAVGITIGLSDREAFVKKATDVLEKYQHDPGSSEHWAKVITKYLEETREDIRLQRNIKNSFSDELPDKENVTQLTKALNELTKELQQQKNK